ncbi:MAG: hypothetical protein ACR2QH_08565 [Geminicoccaceae bacterium]
MSAHTRKAAGIDLGCLGFIFIYLLIECAVYLVAYGEPEGFRLSLLVFAFLWPIALIWWSLFGSGQRSPLPQMPRCCRKEMACRPRFPTLALT